MKVKTEDVNLDQQYFIITIYKRSIPREVKTPIKNSVLDLWKELLEKSTTGDFIFSKGLQPGTKRISERQITRRWKVHVKEKLNIRLYVTVELCTRFAVEKCTT
jgi:hypothetical protein